jgi:predicted aspartyl protease
MVTRRGLLTQAGVLALGAAGFVALRGFLPGAPPQVTWAAAPGGEWISMPGERRRLVIIGAQVNGERVGALVDSGAQLSVLDRGLADRLGLLEGPAAPVVAMGLSGGPQLGSSAAIDLDVGTLRAEGIRAAVLDLGAVARVAGLPFQLIIGRDLLRQVILDLDLPRRRVAFRDPASFTIPEGAQAVGRSGAAGAIYVDVAVEGSAPLAVLVDTGASSALALSTESAQRMGLLDDRPVRTAPSVTMGGVTHDRVVRARWMELSGLRFEDVRVQIYNAHPAAPLPDGLLGAEVLGRYRAILDHRAGTLHLFS